MDDSCAVCADTLKWAAYGPCGHREVCSTCVIRLRLICDDRRCCICKSESNIIFVTKALGDYTKIINDFSWFPADPHEGQVGPYWYHESTQAYFDDADHYKMVKGMCRLSCIVCQKDEKGTAGSKRRGGFKNVEQLKNHILNQHRLLMCGLCLEGRKVFICEQKLYTRAQLTQHMKTGDSEVDGSESDRGGFMGHPSCEFCQNPFYGDNELYLHMSTEHYTCHLCQRQHPGQYEYYRNYDDMEIHFCQEHFLCEDEGCLAKKFVVFATEYEFKRHNAREHGGSMSRSKRKASLQIPISFQYRRSNAQDHQDRQLDSVHDSSDSRFSVAIHNSLATVRAERSCNSSLSAESSFNQQETSEVHSLVGRFEALATLDLDPSRCEQVLGKKPILQESSFPPLAASSNGNQHKARTGSEGLAVSSVNANNRTIIGCNASQTWPAVSRQPNLSASGSFKSRTVPNSKLLSSSSSSGSSHCKAATVHECLPSGCANLQRTIRDGLQTNIGSSSRNLNSTSKVSHSASAPNFVGKGLFDNSLQNFPPVSAAQISKKASTSIHPRFRVEDVQFANKALVVKIRAALEFDEDKYSAFEDISAEYHQSLINTGEYLAYVYQFGLSNLVSELARLCPDVQKQRELVETYKFNMVKGSSHRDSLIADASQSKNKSGSKKGKTKYNDDVANGLVQSSTKSFTNGAKILQSNQKPFVKKMDHFLKDGHPSAIGKSKILSDEDASSNSASQQTVEPQTENGSHLADGCSKKNLATGKGGNRPKKKIPKFLRNRLGDASAATLSDAGNSDPAEHEKPPGRLPVLAWGNGGGRRLVANLQSRRENCRNSSF